ncbi:FkbM family methyltransferase [Candidatus Nucleicultrix amoebiphila]|jgi:FkbM family methyltransferase|uniref:Methyltransferase FkbM domain-containing protein n=1 Tax=Candidatus Nucleicultrix amoebiphila FS5 TaxID=1414854 RepID=A0A1W6N5F8_9PROT|nr:FkbM family methyltransferase [Candidatus Nucleicultrix amoebiphila]ARN85041.1 hypothetical protein GQ61_06775 [Candidatus Nucleicultrix amoebiphila FS5]
MIKQAVKKMIANSAQKLVRFSIHRGCITQDEIINKLSAYEIINTPSGKLTFFCPGEIPIWRARTFFTKEPETLAWIDSFQPDDTLLDIGANIGLYSLYAGLKGHTVCAIEPMSDNFFILQRNININQLKTVQAFCLCLYNQNKLDTLKIRNDGFGQSQNSFDENTGAFDETYEFSYQQGVVGITLDYLAQQTFIPNHIKLDVDGHELKVLEGGHKTLQNKNVKSILIEMNEKGKKHQETCDFICKHGFSIASKSHSEMMNNEKYSKFKNYIFTRIE